MMPRICLLFVAFISGTANAATFTNFFHTGHANGEPGGASVVWGDGGRYQSGYNLVVNANGTLRTVGHMDWNLGPMGPTSLALSVLGVSDPGSYIAPGTGRIEIGDSMSIHVDASTPFSLSGSISRTAPGACGLLITPLNGGPIQSPFADAMGRLVVNAPGSININGVLPQGDYQIDIGGISNPLGGSFSADLMLVIPAPSTSLGALVGIAVALRRKHRGNSCSPFSQAVGLEVSSRGSHD
jgi:hypothetical protein